MNTTTKTLLGVSVFLGAIVVSLCAKKAAEKMIDSVGKEAVKTAFDHSFTETLNRTNQSKEQQ